MPNVTIERKDKTYILLDIPKPDIQIESIDSQSVGSDVYWEYSCVGAHEGDAIKIAVKNPHYEMDGDENGVWYAFTHDGLFWADDLTELDDDVADRYSDSVSEAANEDYNESAD